MHRLVPVLIGVLFPTYALTQEPSSLIGSWRLISYEAPDSTNAARPVWGPDPLGLIVYLTNGTMAAQLYDDRRPSLRTHGTQVGDEAARAAAYAGLAAYYGTYTVDTVSREITHHITGAWVTDWIGQSVIRAYRFLDDDRIELRVVQNPDGQRISRGQVLVWQRVR